MAELSQWLGISDLWQLIAATMIFLMVPGPGTFCLLSSSARHGVRGGAVCLLGLMLADLLLMLLAALGVAALLRANPVLFAALRYAGGGYLVWLGLRLLWTRGRDEAMPAPFARIADFRRGFLVTITNPKAIVFYMAFFPLFIDPAAHHGSFTLMAMAAIICCCTLLYGGFLVLLGGVAATRMRANQGLVKWAGRSAGMALVGFGIKLGIH